MSGNLEPSFLTFTLRLFATSCKGPIQVAKHLEVGLQVALPYALCVKDGPVRALGLQSLIFLVATHDVLLTFLDSEHDAKDSESKCKLKPYHHGFALCISYLERVSRSSVETVQQHVTKEAKVRAYFCVFVVGASCAMQHGLFCFRAFPSSAERAHKT